MIQIYAPNNKNYEMNGDAVLVPSICENSAELGGSWSLNMTHPIDDEGRWENIVEEAVISAPTFMGEKQLFRVVEMDKQDTEITVKAYPIFLDSKDEVFLMDKRPTAKTGQEALNILTEGTKYSGESDIAAGNTAYFVRRNLMDCLNGEYPSFATVWGGEPLYDNFKVIINERAGGDYGAEVRYGKNMEGISFKEALSSVVTRIVPVAYNGRTLSTEYVDSPLIEKYAKIYTNAIKFEDVKWHEDLMESEDTENLIVCYSQEELDAALIAKCNEQFEAGIDLYSVTINVDLVSLENTEEYKDFKDLVRIGLGDDVSCYNNRLGITTKARAIKIVWDCIQNTAKEVVLGDYQTNFLAAWGSVLDKIASSMNQDGTLMAERVAGILNGINTQIKVQSTAAQKAEFRVLLFEDLDPNSALYGALGVGTKGIQIANKRTTDDREWDWSTAMTANGILADAIITGLLADKTGSNYWNLDTGEFKLAKGSISLGKLFSVDDTGKVIANSLQSNNANITGGKIQINGIAASFYPIAFTGTSGDDVRLGPDNTIWRDNTEKTVLMLSGAKMVLGKFLNDTGTSFSGDVSIDPLFGITSKPTYEWTSSNAANVYVGSDGMLYRSSSSSERYKKDITENISNELDPKSLYDVPVKMFKYKDGYLAEKDIKNGKDIIGFIVEDFEEHYPAAVEYVDGQPEMWNSNVLIPAMLKLIQEQNLRIKELEVRNVN